ncbi:tetrathionate reductase family octaheme c-type cytochrome [Ectothiorhodospira marina]|uniref:Octaheme c-type cytochrome, tetrathionate reductase family n=1 Tax=Ectothiorhodospira marina TaxID=1396821 RepID=A0A1H7QMW0_9GAMM|nr:tetrathionate reductase family octaheme c-type cytochrome [Ectothiorhodospira marina]SEL49058.1 octaheme c-type cytochrome, tetrathionate reductase family [Ectothiorhodospira marina]
MSRPLVRAFLVGTLLALLMPPALTQTLDRSATTSTSSAPTMLLESTANHHEFEELSGPFESGPEVTQACLECHTEAALQVHRSIHWTWEYDQPETGQKLGKRFAMNNLCLGIAGSEERCSSCHTGYDFDGPDFDFTAEEKVDCLVCHDTTGTYVKFPTGGGHPPAEDTVFRGTLFKAPDLAEVARNVGKTSRETCGSCHFEGGGGDAVKHGDLDSTLLSPARTVDVHMSPDGLDFSCSTCHEFSGHIQEGSRYHMTAKAEAGIAVPGRENERPACESCHGTEPHEAGVHDKLNQHVENIACQTCHVPELARGGLPTKTSWDWSTAGELDENGRPIVREDEQGRVIYDGMKGSFLWDENHVPEYRWFDGNMRYTLLGERIDPSQPVEVNFPEGTPDDPRARIWPFKVMQGRQPYDTQYEILLLAQLFGRDDNAFWRGYDWDKAIISGMAEARRAGQTDATYSGSFDFVDTRMYWPVNHMVAPKEDSLSCESCHSTDGRLADLPGPYIPGRDRHPWIEPIGWAAVILTLLGVLAHGGIRYLLHRRRYQ